jgi:hypothetical protein
MKDLCVKTNGRHEIHPYSTSRTVLLSYGQSRWQQHLLLQDQLACAQAVQVNVNSKQPELRHATPHLKDEQNTILV